MLREGSHHEFFDLLNAEVQEQLVDRLDSTEEKC